MKNQIVGIQVRTTSEEINAIEGQASFVVKIGSRWYRIDHEHIVSVVEKKRPYCDRHEFEMIVCDNPAQLLPLPIRQFIKRFQKTGKMRGLHIKLRRGVKPLNNDKEGWLR